VLANQAADALYSGVAAGTVDLALPPVLSGSTRIRRHPLLPLDVGAGHGCFGIMGPASRSKALRGAAAPARL
jgi:hypothetical protein